MTPLRTIVFLNSPLPNIPNIHSDICSTDVIICVDGGVRHAQTLNITPHIILGDYDSLPTRTRENYRDKPIEWISHTPEKDQYETDSELAIRVAKKRGATECLIYGFSGGRLDHMTANLFLFARYAKAMSITIIEPHQRLTFVTTAYEWEGKSGDIVSLVAMSNSVRGVTTDNLQYPLTDFTLKQGATLGVSNVMTASGASVKMRSGILLVVHTDHV